MRYLEKYKDYNRSQSALKDFEKELTCPVRWKHQWLMNEFEYKPSDAMRMGLLFETLVLGATAKDDSISVDDFPKNKDGSLKADIKRIVEQAEYCKDILFNKEHKDYIGVTITDAQLTIYHKRNRIVIDALGTNSNGLVMLDLKFTGDVNSTFGDYCWGTPDKMDLIQQGFYQMIVEDKYGKKIDRNILLVFDNKPHKGKKLIEVNLTDAGRERVRERIGEFDTIINEYEEEGWPYMPSLSECKDCQLASCPYRFNEANLEFFNVDI